MGLPEVTKHIAYRGTYNHSLAPRLVKLPTFSKNSKMEFDDSHLTPCSQDRIVDVPDATMIMDAGRKVSTTPPTA